MRNTLKGMDRMLDAISGRRDNRRAEAQQISQPLLRPRRLQPAYRRLRYPRRVRFPTGLIRPAMDTGNLTLRPNSTVYEVTVDKNSGKADGVKLH